MPSRTDFEKLNCMIAEATAHCEATHRRLEQILEEILQSVDKGLANCAGAIQEEQVHKQLRDARARLSNLRRIRGDQPTH